MTDFMDVALNDQPGIIQQRASRIAPSSTGAGEVMGIGRPEWLTENYGENGEHRYPVWYGTLSGQVDSFLATMKHDPTSPTALDRLEKSWKQLKKQESEFYDWYWDTRK